MPFFLPILGTIIGGLATSAIGSALAPKQPGQPGYGALTAAGRQAELETLPERRMLEQAARIGAKVRVPKDPTPIYEKQQMVRVGDRNSVNQQWVPFVSDEWKPGGKYYQPGVTPQTETRNVVTGYTPNYEEHDFTGKGEIQTQAQLGEELAKVALETQQKYGEDFARNALEQQELADPEGAAARRLLYKGIQDLDARQTDDRIANETQRQLEQQLMAGAGFTADQQSRLEAALLDRAAMGDSLQGDAIMASLESGPEAQSRLWNRQQNNMAFIQQGASAEDGKYRRGQQTMQNYGAFLSGVTPQAQFGNMSASQQGTAPVQFGQSGPMFTGQTGNAAASAGMANYRQALSNQSQMANPWTAAIGLALSGAGAAGAAGWRPFKS